MSTIKVHFKKVHSIGKDFKSNSTRTANSVQNVSAISGQIDSKIKARRYIDDRLSDVQTSLSQVERDVEKLQKFITRAAEQYEDAEERIEKATDKFVGESIFKKTEDLKNLIYYATRFLDKATVIDLISGGQIKFTLKNLELIAKYVGPELKAGTAYNSNNAIKSLLATLGGDSQRYTGTFMRLLESGVPLVSLKALLKAADGKRVDLSDQTLKKIVKRVINGENIRKFFADTNSPAYNNARTKVFEKMTGKIKSGLQATWDVLKRDVRDIPNAIDWKKVGGSIDSGYSATKGFVGEQVKGFGYKLSDEIVGVGRDFKFWAGETSFAKLARVGGVVSTVWTVGDNFVEAKNSKEDKTFIDKATTFFSGSAVDIGLAAVSAAGGAQIGAAVGSFIVPPIGTVVGAGVGIFASIAIDKVFSMEFGKEGNKKTVKSVLKDGVKYALNKKVEAGEKKIKFFKDSARKVQYAVSNLGKGMDKGLCR